MNYPLQKESLSAYRWWSKAAADALDWQFRFVEAQYQAAVKFLQAALPVPAIKDMKTEQRGGAAAPTKDDLAEIERLALERVRHGQPVPPALYDVTYRDRVDWFRFPEWARPSDPELFQDCTHEG
jgi:hypothetical protein